MPGTEPAPGPIVTFAGEAGRCELRGLVRRTAEGAPSALLEEEVDDLVRADRYERAADREAHRASHCERGPTTTSGQVTHKTPKLKDARARDGDYRAPRGP